MPLSPGVRLGPYEILAPLGAGGMGEVYRARDTRLQREVAVKVLPAAMASDAGALRRMEQEARAVAALNHPNLLSVYDIGTSPEGVPFLVTELLEGETLRRRLAEGGVSQRKAVEWALQIAHGLAAAHDKGIVHRDLKPDNIFVCADGRVKILDFGLAKLNAQAQAEDKTAAAAATAPGIVLGTIGYMAPEQVRGQGADARSDIFSFGAVLYEMLAGRRAFAGDSAADVMSAILKEDPPELAGSQPPLAPALERIVHHCLEKEPKQRFQSASDVALYLSDLSTASGAGSGVGMLPPAPAEQRGARRLAFASVGTLGLIAAVGLTWTLRPGTPPPPQFHRVTFQQQAIGSSRFLPDGQSVLGETERNGNDTHHLFTARLDVPGMQSLAPAGVVLAVGPGQVALLQNTRLIAGAYFVGTLAVMPLAGGAPRPVLGDVQSADFAPGNGDLAVVRFHPSTATTTLEYPMGHVLATTTGYFSGLRFSRDGRRLGFFLHPSLGDDMGYAAVVDLAGREKVLTRRYASANGLAWSPRGNEIWYSAGNTNQLALHAVTLAGRDRLLLAAPTKLNLQDVLPDGRVLVMAMQERLDAEVATASDPHPRSLTVLDWSADSMVSADGQEVLVDDEDSGPEYGIYLRKPDGSPPVRLGDGDPVALSPDGQWAVSVLPSNQQLELLPTGAGEPRQLTHGSISFLADVQDPWLPDGKAILALGKEPGHSSREFLVTLDGAVRPVTPEHVSGSVLTPDGSAVLTHFHAGNGAGPYNTLYPLNGGPARPVHGLQPGDNPLRLAPGGDWVYVSAPCPAGQQKMCHQLLRVNWDTGQRQPLFTVIPDDAAGITSYIPVSISADGKTYTMLAVRNLDTLYVISGLR